ncbi:MAG: phosphonate degradation associated HDIG domain protein [Pirellulaceae bacterium]|jgi:phosphonate degradation associated HDIG domain protein
MSVVDKIAELFVQRGDSLYGGEAVTQQEHALQAALSAENSAAGAELIAAALLHDIGHLLHDLPDDATDNGIDDVHEELGERWLRKFFNPAVSEPVRLHVSAKRFLCATEAEYFSQLSPTSVQSLKLQGGPYNAEEVAKFEQSPFFREAVELRRWDDEAKVVGLATPAVNHFLQYVEIALNKHRDSAN